MTELSDKSIKNLTKKELRTELTNCGLGTQGTKKVLLNLTITCNKRYGRQKY